MNEKSINEFNALYSTKYPSRRIGELSEYHDALEWFQLGRASVAEKVPVEAIQSAKHCLKGHAAYCLENGMANMAVSAKGEIKLLETFLAHITSIKEGK